MEIEHQAARFMCDVAEALEKIGSGKTSYGEFYASQVVIGFDGEDTSLRVIPNEHGGYSLAVDGDPQ